MGGILTLSPWVLQRHRSRWNDPDGFCPERFLGEGEREAIREAYLPFGLGPRRCPGAAFAQQEALVLLVALLGRFRLEAAGAPPRLVGRLTLRSTTGAMVTIRLRHRTDRRE